VRFVFVEPRVDVSQAAPGAHRGRRRLTAAHRDPPGAPVALGTLISCFVFQTLGPTRDIRRRSGFARPSPGASVLVRLGVESHDGGILPPIRWAAG